MGKQNSQNKYNSYPESAHAVRVCPATIFPCCFELLTSKLFFLLLHTKNKSLFSRDCFFHNLTFTQSNCVKSVYLDLMSSHDPGKPVC